MKKQKSLSNEFSTNPFVTGVVGLSVQVSVQVHILKSNLLFT